jgi:hypothetical protein
MPVLLKVLESAVAIGWLVCFILVLIRMFQEGHTGLGIACIVLIFCGVGGLIAFVYGWMKAGEWGITKIMVTWTGCIIAGIILALASAAMTSGDGAQGFAVLNRITG